MTPLTVGAIGIGILFALLFSGMPIGFVMALVGFIGFAYLVDFNSALGILRIVPYTTFADYGLSVIPLFILMGEFAFFAGLSKDLYDAVHSWLGQLRGGLAMATTWACAGFAAVSGSSLATAATMGSVALPEMRRYHYDDALATGAIAAGGTMGILIPPSVILVLYGIITEQSIGKLFLAGFIPGVLEAAFYTVTIYILCKRNPRLGPPGPRTTMKQKIVSLKNTWIVLLLFILVIGGLYKGVFSPTEAAGVGAFGAFVFGLARRRLGLKAIKSSLNETGKTTAMIFIIVMGAMILGYFLAVSRVPFELASIIGGLEVNRYIILAVILVFYIFLGCVMDSMAMMLITVPIFFPLIVSLGFNPIWFGIIMVRICEIGLITPPVGLNVFIISGIAKDVPLEKIFRGVMPYLFAMVVAAVILLFVPQIATWLPNLAGP